jgi:hypothetical protein
MREGFFYRRLARPIPCSTRCRGFPRSA